MNITEEILLDCGFTKTHAHGIAIDIYQKGKFKVFHNPMKGSSYSNSVSLKSGCFAHVDTFERLQELYMEEAGQLLIPINTKLTVSILRTYGFSMYSFDKGSAFFEKTPANKKPISIGYINGVFCLDGYESKTLKTLNELTELYHVLTGETLTPVKA